MAGFAYFATQEATRIKLAATVDDALNRIESRVSMHLALLNSVHALFKAREGDVGRAAFATLFDALAVDANFPGLRGRSNGTSARRGRCFRRATKAGGRRSSCSRRSTTAAGS